MYPQKKISIVGAGISAAIYALYIYKESKRSKIPVRLTLSERNNAINDTTSARIAPSFTPDEITSVVPPVNELLEKLGIPFYVPGGIRVDDVPGIKDSPIEKEFIRQVSESSTIEGESQKRTDALLRLGKLSMELWQRIFDEADPELKIILEGSNFNPCREPRKQNKGLQDGYRIDLIYNTPEAAKKASSMKDQYEQLGYQHCSILSPTKVMEIDPQLINFCLSHSTENDTGERVWNNDSVALYRPGGCLDAEVFLQKLYPYLQSVMGTYVNADGETKNCFQLKLNHNVSGVVFDESQNIIQGLQFPDKVKITKPVYQQSEYVFCPGEAVGTLQKFGFQEPSFAGFAGASLKLNIPLPPDLSLEDFNHCMEVHGPGVVLAWQGRVKTDDNNKKTISIAVAGTKAFYAGVKPDVNQAFARNRNLLQLNMINDVLPQIISLALGRETKGQLLTEADLFSLEAQGIATRWVGTRAVTYDGFPTLTLHNARGKEVINGFTTTHLGSGGVSFAPATVLFSRNSKREKPEGDLLPADLLQEVLAYGRSNRGSR